MAKYFTRETETGGYKVTAYTRNDFRDGGLRIEPPVQANADFWEFVGSEDTVKFFEVFSGKVATIATFEASNGETEQDVTLASPQSRVDQTVGKLLGELVKLESLENFITENDSNPENIGEI